ncbi:hypothetical protein DB30_04012 [Enhygromyxa salina]|uniref:Uncharacterized protein n=1 Tax=Enhygromyxa salina TaxID=215803 RepID=A0A0C2D575_9BACT|nr:hypothetical protein [Enhygromyxa salina]KIG16850.1 hypothetical protein DB30_04012 [Enhygromyxa salina]
MTKDDPYLVLADALVGALESARGDASEERAAIQAAIDGYLAIAGGGDPAELMVAEYFCQEGRATQPPALERVRGAGEDDLFRWSELMAELAGY